MATLDTPIAGDSMEEEERENKAPGGVPSVKKAEGVGAVDGKLTELTRYSCTSCILRSNIPLLKS